MIKCRRVTSFSGSKWAISLPADVAFVILDKLLEPIDHLHFAAVSKLWHFLAKKYNHTTHRWPKLLPPMLILPGNHQDLIYSLSEATVYHNIHLAMPPSNGGRHRRYYACGNGWFASMEFCGIQFHNPFTRATHELTCIESRFEGRSTAPKHAFAWMAREKEQFPRLILYGDPCVNEGNSFMVVAFYANDSSLGFIRGQQLLWSSIETAEQYAITDAIFYQGQVYAVDKNLGRIVSFDVNTCTSGNTVRAKILNTTYMRPSSQSYLVESATGELLHVRRFLKVQRNWGELTMPVTLTFEVYKLVFDDDGYVVQQVELKTLGDQTLFVGDSQSMSVSASSFSWCRPNSIYYTSDLITVDEDDYLNFISCCQCDMGIFNLEDRTTTPLQCYPQHSTEEYRSEPAAWILPPIKGLC